MEPSKFDRIRKATRSSPYPDVHSSAVAIKEIRSTLSAPDATHIIQKRCLARLTELVSAPSDYKTCESFPSTSKESGQSLSSEALTILKILRDYSRHTDSRVRSAALSGLLKLHERGIPLDISLYTEFCEALKDDYEECRVTAVHLLHSLSTNYGDCLVCVSSGEEQIRLADDAFGRTCSLMSDISLRVRTEAASLLGSFTTVSPEFLDQTLDKKLMSNLKKKKTAHERNREAYSAGEWSSGRKWASDAPQESICPEEVNLMDFGACGAFVHGLEDEFLEVRMATLESMQRLSVKFPSFAEQSLDFLIDMFNDEIEEIRLKAIQVLSCIGLESVVLRDDQVQIIVAAFEEHSSDIREALYDMLGNCTISTPDSLRSCVDVLLSNLNKHPEDKPFIWVALRKLGLRHAAFVSSLVRDLLGIHPFLELSEPSIEDQSYISLLILTFNAASLEDDMNILSQLEYYTPRHYSYLRHAHPDLVPVIPFFERDRQLPPLKKSIQPSSHMARKFLCDVFTRIRKSIESKSITIQTQVIELSIQDLKKMMGIEKNMSCACDFLIHYLNCQLSIQKILTNSNWINALLLSPLQSSIFRSSLQSILFTTFHLNYKFHGMHPFQTALIQQTRVKALALQLMAIIHGSNASALSLCDAFLEELANLRKLLECSGLTADSLTTSMIQQISLLEEPKPGSVARVLQPLFLGNDTSSPPGYHFADLSMMVCEETLDSLTRMKESWAEVHEPQPRSDAITKFTAGLVLSVKFRATIHNVRDPRLLRIRIKYPDQKTHLFFPKKTDFKPISCDSETGVQSYRLLTQVSLSYSCPWTESCVVELVVVLDLKDASSSLSISQAWAVKTGSYTTTATKTSASRGGVSDENMQIDLSPPVKLNIWPRAVKRTVV